MNYYLRVAALVCLLGFLRGGPAASAQTGNSSDPAAQLPDGIGKGYVETLCGSCHGVEMIVSQRKSRQQWEGTVYDMLDRISPGLEREAAIIVDYLAEHFAASDGTASAPPVRISHQVLFNFKPDVTENRIAEVLTSGKQVLQGVPTVITVMLGKVLQGENTEFRYGLLTTFRSREDLEAYRNHPGHRKWVEEVFRPAIAKSVVTDIEASE